MVTRRVGAWSTSDGVSPIVITAGTVEVIISGTPPVGVTAQEKKESLVYNTLSVHVLLSFTF